MDTVGYRNPCHTSTHTNNFFTQDGKAVRLYNEGCYDPATKMLNELKDKGLLKDNPWTDEFQITYYYLWHHKGRRARQGAMMGAPDYAPWHGSLELQQDLYKLEGIHKKRMESGEIDWLSLIDDTNTTSRLDNGCASEFFRAFP